jgi:hypothetical protein
MADHFLDRIPTLSDDALRAYLDGHAMYKREAIEAAAAELARRGLEVPEARLEAIRGDVEHRDAGGDSARRPTFLRDAAGPRMGRIRFIAGGILAAGATTAAVILFRAQALEAGLDLEPQDSKSYLRQMEMVGGKANLVASEVRHGVSALLHGTNLAWTVLALTLLTAGVFWVAATQGHRGVAGSR